MEKNQIINLIDKVISQLVSLELTDVEETCPIGIVSMNNWEWPQGVALFALYNYYKETENEEVYSYIVDWFDKQIANGLPEKNVNTMCPMLTLSYVYEKEKKASYLEVMKEWADYAVNEMPRTEENGLQHCVSGILNEGQLWDDTLYMTVLFVARMSVLFEEERFLQESIRQFMIHIKYLTDNKTGLFFHGWTFDGRHNFAEALWGRGNSWYTAGLVDYLDMAELPKGLRLFLLSTLEQQVKKLSELQSESGLWHTLLDDPDSYLETSCTAAFGYGILKAVRKGYIDESYIKVGKKALRGVIESIDADGVVQGVSYGTGLYDNLQKYKDIEICPMPYGQSMALLLLVESLKHFYKK